MVAELFNGTRSESVASYKEQLVIVLKEPVGNFG